MKLSVCGSVMPRAAIFCQRGALIAFFAFALYLRTHTASGQTKEENGGSVSLIAALDGWQPDENVRYAVTPNDPYYTAVNPAGFPGQWHLSKQNSTASVDANVVGAWNRN